MLEVGVKIERSCSLAGLRSPAKLETAFLLLHCFTHWQTNKQGALFRPVQALIESQVLNDVQCDSALIMLRVKVRVCACVSPWRAPLSLLGGQGPTDRPAAFTVHTCAALLSLTSVAMNNSGVLTFWRRRRSALSSPLPECLSLSLPLPSPSLSALTSVPLTRWWLPSSS